MVLVDVFAVGLCGFEKVVSFYNVFLTIAVAASKSLEKTVVVVIGVTSSVRFMSFFVC